MTNRVIGWCSFDRLSVHHLTASVVGSRTGQLLGSCPLALWVVIHSCCQRITIHKQDTFTFTYVHFRANTLGKGMNPLILPPAMGK